MNTALALTIARILFVPAIIYLLYTPARVLTAFLFALLSFTDWLDGYVARKFDQGSDLGKFLDPLADKILVMSILVVLAVFYNNVLFTSSVIFLLVREFTIMGFRAVAAGKNKIIAASQSAKLKTALQMVALFLILAKWPGGLVLYYLSCLVALYSLIEYLWLNRQVLA